jgi:hypothetical protein
VAEAAGQRMGELFNYVDHHSSKPLIGIVYRRKVDEDES